MSAIIDAILGRLPDVEPIAFSSGVHTPNSDRTLQTTTHTLGVDGTLTGLEAVTVAGSPQMDLYVKVTLEDDQQIERSTLFRGYIDGSSTPNGNGAIPVKSTWKLKLESWGYVSNVNLVLRGTMLSKKRQAGGWTPTNESSLTGQGNIRSITGTNPATEANFSETVPTGARWRLINLNVEFVTSATSANRIVKFTFKDSSSNIYSIVEPVAPQTASQARRYTVQSGAPAKSALEDQVLLPLSPNNLLSAGQQFTSITAGFSSGDDFASPQYIVEDWIDIA